MHRGAATGRRRASRLPGGDYEALSDAHLHADWVSGISVGAINGALIAGIPPDARVENLRDFWELINHRAPWDGLRRSGATLWVLDGELHVESRTL
jgi:NTE family protein